MPFFECTLENPFIASAALDTEFAGVGLRVERDKYLKKSKNREYGSFINLYHLLAVRGQAMAEIRSANLKGLKLIALETILDGGKWPDGIEPLHLVWSDYVLPPTSSKLTDRHSQPVDPSTPGFFYPAGGCYLEAGPLAGLEYEALNDEAFDIGITFENFGGGFDCYRRIIYSQKATDLFQGIMTNLRLSLVITKGEQGGGGNSAALRASS